MHPLPKPSYWSALPTNASSTQHSCWSALPTNTACTRPLYWSTLPTNTDHSRPSYWSALPTNTDHVRPQYWLALPTNTDHTRPLYWSALPTNTACSDPYIGQHYWPAQTIPDPNTGRHNLRIQPVPDPLYWSALPTKTDHTWSVYWSAMRRSSSDWSCSSLRRFIILLYSLDSLDNNSLDNNTDNGKSHHIQQALRMKKWNLNTSVINHDVCRWYLTSTTKRKKIANSKNLLIIEDSRLIKFTKDHIWARIHKVGNPMWTAPAQN